ncbi:MAG: hypothetical protein ABIO38_02645 [Luteimonas sp.]
MATDKPEPWTRKNPKPKAARTPLTVDQKAAAKKRADAAGRRYPNLIDNMWAARQPPAALKQPD